MLLLRKHLLLKPLLPLPPLLLKHLHSNFIVRMR